MTSGLFRGILLGATGAVGLSSIPNVDEEFSINDIPRNLLRGAMNTYDAISGHSRNVHRSSAATQDTNSQNASNAELQKLSQQIAELKLARGEKQVIIYGGSSTGSGIIKVVIIGSAGVLVLYYFGYSLNDVMYVTKTTLNSAVKNLEEQIGFVGVKLQKTKEELFAKIGMVEEMIYGSQKELETKIEYETGEVRKKIDLLDGRFFTMQKSQDEIRITTGNMGMAMKKLEEKFDKNGEELERANSGIRLLISSVMDLPHVQQNKGLMTQLRTHVTEYTTGISRWLLQRSNSSPQMREEENDDLEGQQAGGSVTEKSGAVSSKKVTFANITARS